MLNHKRAPQPCPAAEVSERRPGDDDRRNDRHSITELRRHNYRLLNVWTMMMPKRPAGDGMLMIDQIAAEIAKADGGDLRDNPARYRRHASAALKPLLKPTEGMIDAAHEAVWFDAFWAINSRRDFRKAVRSMITAAIKEGPGGR